MIIIVSAVHPAQMRVRGSIGENADIVTTKTILLFGWRLFRKRLVCSRWLPPSL